MPPTNDSGDFPNARESAFVAAGDDDALELPDSEDLLKQLQFSLRDGRITLGSERMVLFHVRALAVLRAQLLETLGLEATRRVFLRIGYTSGFHDALQSKKIRSDHSLFELLSAGPQLHALEGMAAVRPLEVRFDRARGEYYGEYIWRNSAEAEAALIGTGVQPVPTCWLLLGYATGYTSGFMGRTVVYREVSCRGCGARNCRIVGRPLDAWHEPLEGFEFLYPQSQERQPQAAGDIQRDELPFGLLGTSAAFTSAWSLVKAAAPTTTPVLLHGEIGTGRTTLADALHRLSTRSDGPQVSLGAGHENPAAVRSALTRAGGGTLVLDELDAWEQASQYRLLEHLDAYPRHDPPVRLVVTMTRDPDDSRHTPLTVRLLYRLAGFPIHLPPLRDRREDILPLANHLREQHATSLEKDLPGFTPRAQRALAEHDYPGNLHELANVVERAAIVVDPGSPIDVGHLFGGEVKPIELFRVSRGRLFRDEPESEDPELDIHSFVTDALTRGVPLEVVEEALIRGAVARSDGNLAAAARTLGLTRAQLAYRFRKLDESTEHG